MVLRIKVGGDDGKDWTNKGIIESDGMLLEGLIGDGMQELVVAVILVVGLPWFWYISC